MLQRLLLITLTLCSLTASAQWQQTGSKVRYVNGLGIPTKDTAAGVSADSSQIVIRPADSSLYVKYKRTWIRVGGGGGSIGGSGTTNYVPKFTASGFIGNSQIFDNGTNVGIGTTSPWERLSIPFNYKLSFGDSTYPLSISRSSAGNLITTISDNYDVSNTRIDFVMRNGSANQNTPLSILSTGNVGIGYTAPVAKLSVNGTILINTNTDNGVDKLQVSGSAAISSDVTIGPYQTGASGVSLTPGNNYSFGEGSGTSYVNLFRQANSAAAILGKGYKYSSTSNGFASSLGGSFAKSAISVGDDIKFFADNPTNVANGTDITPTERMSITPSGVTASGTLTAATIVKSGGTSLQFLMADGSTSLGGGGTFSGTTNYVPKFTSSTAIGNSQIIDDGNNLSLRTTGSTYAVNINTGANSGMAFYQDGTTATILGTNQNLTSTAPLGFIATQYIFSGASGGKITVNTGGDNGVDHLQVNGSISGIGMKQGYVAKTGAYTATDADYVIDCTSGTFTVTLPASSGRTGRILIIKNSGAGTITVDGNSSESIDGAATVTLSVQYATIQIMSDGTNWKTIAKF